MTIIQIILILFIIFALSRVFLRLKEGTISWKEFSFWTIVWTTGIVIVTNPKIPGRISYTIGIGRPADLILYTSTALLFYLVFRIYIKLNQMEESTTKIVREVSIEKARKNEPKSNKNN